VTSQFAHHTHLSYEQRTDPTVSYRAGFPIEQNLRLTGVDVASQTFTDGSSGTRRQVHRYHLSYESGHASLLSSVQVEGRCSGDEGSAPAEDNSQTLPAGAACPMLPAMTFGYTHVEGSADLPGYEAINETLHNVSSSPPNSVDEELTDLYDINSDGLPDVLVTDPGTYSNGHGVFFNAQGGTADSFGKAQVMHVQGVLGANATTLTFRNLNLAGLDLDGDGTIDLLHMPAVKTYAIYTPTLSAGSWSWVGRAVTTASGQNPKIDFGKDTLNTKVLDVNGDGLVDLVVSTGTEYQTFFSLGRMPQGDGQFGHGSWSSPVLGNLSTDPVRTCVPWSATPVQLSDPDVQLADMNGDGLADIVRVRRGDIRYWPGRGNGFWGTGSRSDCGAGTFESESRLIAMDTSPFYTDIQGTTLRMDDVNGDGLDDLVQVNFDTVSVWLNVDGKSWTKRHIINNTPASPSYADRVRLVDINGSGTRDVLWGSGGKYQYIDLQGGVRPWLLNHVENGLGKTTDIEYGTSTDEMLAAERTGVACDQTKPWSSAWCSKMPTVAHVVKRVTDSDNISIGGASGQYVTEYQYRDPVFEGRQREFRGFSRARSHRLGDANSPSDYTESTFLLGECEDETPTDGVDNCALSERWRDNPREALKGLPVVTEKYDDAGVYLSTEVSTYRLRHLYAGLDGREVRVAFESDQQATSYDTALGPQAASFSSATVVNLESVPPDANGAALGSLQSTRTASVPLRGASGYATVKSNSAVDAFGNRVVATSLGCTAGACPGGTSDSPGIASDETIKSYTLPTLISENSHWLWRTGTTYVIGDPSAGDTHGIQRALTVTTYNANGAPTSTSVTLSGTAVLDRVTAQGGGLVAATPTTASSNTSFVASTLDYDTFGNVTKEQGPTLGTANRRCRVISYEGSIGALGYATFPTSETIYVGGCDGSGVGQGLGLSTTAMYDRGLGQLTQASDFASHFTFIAYDSFGRMVALRRPHGADGTSSVTEMESTKIDYTLPSPANPNYSIIHTQTQDGADESVASYLESFSYVDGLGRTRATRSEADSTLDGYPWVVSGFVSYDAKGALQRKYLAQYNDGTDPLRDALGGPPSNPYGSQRYDAFGRQVQTYDLDGTVTLQSQYHALSTDLYDAADLEAGTHQGTYASTRMDGHGRTIATTERIHSGTNGSIESHEVRTSYLPTGEPETITRVTSAAGQTPVSRWMRYDSLGRMVLNVEPNTTYNQASAFTSGLSNLSVGATIAAAHDTNYNSTTAVRTWRYAYNNAGDLVGTSDPNGCGENFGYDGAGRLVTEDYSPCTASSHRVYTAPTGSAYAGYEVVYFYDQTPTTLPSAFTNPPSNGANASNLLGRLVAEFDRGQTSWHVYDARGRLTRTDKRIAKPIATTVPPAWSWANYTAEWFTKTTAYDAADREVTDSTGATQLLGTSGSGTGKSEVYTSYTARGTVKSVSSSYGSAGPDNLVNSVVRDADGLVTSIEYNDVAKTKTTNTYDSRRRLNTVETSRSPATTWSPPAPPNYTPAPAYGAPTPSTFQLTLQFNRYTYDAVNNPIQIDDLRVPEEWPAGSKPVTRKIKYDDLYRATRVDYQYAGGTDAYVSPYAADLGTLNDPRRTTPMPHATLTGRMLWQTYTYDWLGNQTGSDDDEHSHYERSLAGLGRFTNAGKPYQFVGATHSVPGGFDQLVTTFDRAGNTTGITFARPGATCDTGTGCQLSSVALAYDEVERLQWARRADGNPQVLTSQLYYQYDASDERVSTAKVDAANVSTNTEYIFDSLELRKATYDTATRPMRIWCLKCRISKRTECASRASRGTRRQDRTNRLHRRPRPAIACTCSSNSAITSAQRAPCSTKTRASSWRWRRTKRTARRTPAIDRIGGRALERNTALPAKRRISRLV
jgi:YD repeat-containing protein